MHYCRLLIAVSLGMLLAGCSSGHHRSNHSNRENPGKTVIALMDTNGDGHVSWEENSAYFDKLFVRLDVNRDGYVTAEEFKAIDNDPLFKAMPLSKLQISFAMFDRNDDGKLSRDEFEHMGDRIFTLLDRNMDGVISPSDFEDAGDCSDEGSDGRSGGKGRGGSVGGGGF